MPTRPRKRVNSSRKTTKGAGPKTRQHPAPPADHTFMTDLYGDGWDDPDDVAPRHEFLGRGIAETGERCAKCRRQLRGFDEYAIWGLNGEEKGAVCEACEEMLGL